MGVGTPQDLVEAIGGGRRHVRLRAADAQRAQRRAVHLAGPPEHPQRAVRARPAPARPELPAAIAAAGSAGPTCGICSSQRRSSRPSCSRCTTCSFYLDTMESIRQAITAQRFEELRRAILDLPDGPAAGEGLIPDPDGRPRGDAESRRDPEATTARGLHLNPARAARLRLWRARRLSSGT